MSLQRRAEKRFQKIYKRTGLEGDVRFRVGKTGGTDAYTQGNRVTFDRETARELARKDDQARALALHEMEHTTQPNSMSRKMGEAQADIYAKHMSRELFGQPVKLSNSTRATRRAYRNRY